MIDRSFRIVCERPVEIPSHIHTWVGCAKQRHEIREKMHTLGVMALPIQKYLVLAEQAIFTDAERSVIPMGQKARTLL